MTVSVFGYLTLISIDFTVLFLHFLLEKIYYHSRQCLKCGQTRSFMFDILVLLLNSIPELVMFIKICRYKLRKVPFKDELLQYLSRH